MTVNTKNPILSIKSGKIVGRQGISRAINPVALEVPILLPVTRENFLPRILKSGIIPNRR